MQLSDTHWGFQGPPNPDATNTLRKAVASRQRAARHRRSSSSSPATSRTPPTIRPSGAGAWRSSATSSAALKVKHVRFMPGEHDASLDRGAAYKEFFGETLLCVRPQGRALHRARQRVRPGRAHRRRAARLDEADLAKRAKDAPIVVLTHRPLFDLEPQVGLGDARRRAGDRDPDAVPERDSVLWPHPPGAPPHDGAHRASLGEVADLSACRRRAASPTARRCPGIRRSRTAAWAFAKWRPSLTSRSTSVQEFGVPGADAMTARHDGPDAARSGASSAAPLLAIAGPARARAAGRSRRW